MHPELTSPIWIVEFESGLIEEARAADLDEALDVLARSTDAMVNSPTTLDTDLGRWLVSERERRA